MKRNSTLACVTIATLMFAGRAHGGMTLTVDRVLNTITFTGADTATLDPEFVFSGPRTDRYEGELSWAVGNVTGGLDRIDRDDGTESLFVGFNGTTAAADPSDRSIFLVYDNGVGGVGLLMFIPDEDSALAEFGGSGIPFSYDGLLSPATDGNLESFDGQDMLPQPSSSGTGHGPITIVVVPEPSSLALLGLRGLLAARRRR